MARAFERRVTLGRILETEKDVRPYLASIIVAAMQKAGDTLLIPDDLMVSVVAPEEFKN